MVVEQHLFLLLRLQVVVAVVLVQDLADLRILVVVLEDQVVTDLMLQLIQVEAAVVLKTEGQQLEKVDQEW